MKKITLLLAASASFLFASCAADNSSNMKDMDHSNMSAEEHAKMKM